MSDAYAAEGLPVLVIGPVSDAAGQDEPPGAVLQQWLDVDGRVVASGGREGSRRWMHWWGLGTYHFDSAGPVRAIPRAAGLEDALTDAFLRGVSPVVMLARGCEAFHGSAVADSRGVVMFCASSGTGKSTTALALAATGLRHWADDSVVYRVAATVPTAVRLPCPIRVDDRARGPLGHARIESDDGTERPLRRVYLLTRDSSVALARPSFDLLPPRARFDRLLAHAHPFDLDGEARRRQFLESLLSVAASTEVHECRFAPSLDALPDLARAIRAHLDSE